MKRKFVLLFAAILMFSLLCDCTTENTNFESGKPVIVCTLFPQYDFARAIACGRFEVKLLLAPGMESHSFDPSPADVIMIQKSALFIYTGENMEPWAAKLIAAEDAPPFLDVSTGVALSGEHDHGEHDGHDHDEDEHAHAHDPHIWTSPVNAIKMVENIRDAFITIDPDGEQVYTEDAAAYIVELKELDRELREVVETSERNKLIFGGRFAFHYLAEEYGLDCISAYDSCSHETEPSAAAVAELVKTVRAEGLPVVYHEEISDPKVARMIAQETGAEMRLLHSCHNLTKSEFDAGESYLSLMKKNAENIKAGLN